MKIFISENGTRKKTTKSNITKGMKKALKEGLGHLPEGRATGTFEKRGSVREILTTIAKALNTNPVKSKGFMGEQYTFKSDEGELVIKMNSPADKKGIYIRINGKPLERLSDLGM